MPDLHELLAREASRGGLASPPPFETLVARSRVRRVKQALAAAATVVAVTAAVAVPLIVDGHGSTVVAGPAVTTTDAARLAAVQQVVDQMVAEVNLPVGAIPLATPPAPLASVSPIGDSVTAERNFTVSGTMASVLAYVKAHPPAGLYGNGTSESSDTGSDGKVESLGISFASAETSSYEAPQLSVDVVQQATGVAVRVSAEATLRPLRTTAELVPANAASVSVTYQQSGVTSDKSWGSAQAQVLAGALNALYTQGSNITDLGCATSKPIYTVTFEVSRGPLVFSDYGCGFIAVSAGGVSQPALETGSVESRLFSMLGLQPAPASSAPPAGEAAAPVSSPAR